MNDFLQSLRSNPAEKPRHAMTRKTYDAAFQNPNHQFGFLARSSQPYQNRQPSPIEEPTGPQLQDAIFDLNNHIESLGENQKSLIKAQEKTADMLERQANAIERIIDHLISSNNNFKI